MSELGEKVQDKKLSFEMIDENRTLHKCCCWYTNSWYVMYDDKNIKIEDQKAFSDVLNTFINGLHIDKYLSYFDGISETTLRNNLILPLPATARLLGFDTDWENSEYGDNLIQQNGNDILFNRLIIFWTGDNGVEQPSMYFLKKEMIEKYVHKIEALFLSGALGKVQLLIRGKVEICNYFVPFYSSNINHAVWQEIMQDRNFSIKTYTSKFSRHLRYY